MMGPLSGVRVVELAAIGPVPWAGMVLSDLGAEVIRVDRTRPAPLDGLFQPDYSLRGRRSIGVDLHLPEGVEVVLRLASTADIFLEGFRPGVVERLGVGPEPCLARRPSLVYGRMTGWGQTGPRSGTAGHDITYLAVSGILSALGPPDYPLAPMNLLADYGGGGMLLLVGVLAGYIHAGASGQGQVVDAAMVDGVSLLSTVVRSALASGTWRERRQSNLLDGGCPYYRTYRTADDRFVAVGALEPRFYAALLDGLGLDPAVLPDRGDVSRWPELADHLGTAFGRRTLSHWAAVFADSDACVAPVLSLGEAAGDPHLRHRLTLVEAEGGWQPGPAPRFQRTALAPPGPPRVPGADSTSILENLGYDESDISRLLQAQVVIGAPRE
ncbi:MAG: CaiB/BaiF CoA transferase family protein [Actinomycetota bacterium]